MSWDKWRAQHPSSELLGHIRSADGAVVECAVSDLSEAGAALRTEVPLPAEFDLEIPEMRLAFRASLCWKSQSAAGVCFMGLTDSSD